MDVTQWSLQTSDLLSSLGFSYEKPKSLAEAVLRLSDHYQQTESTTPWDESWAQAAYLAYFLPLNLVRFQSLLREAKALGFWQDEQNLYDFGAGPAAGALALAEESLASYTAIESSRRAQNLFHRLQPTNFRADFPIRWSQKAPKSAIPENSLGVFSYSLNELTPTSSSATKQLMKNFDGVMILEPSTQQAGRQLLQLRQELIDAGFSLWGPCLHQRTCPLLTQSKRDWCHHRAHWSMPKWFQALDRELPIKNQTLTYSYLLARKETAPVFPENTFRLTGDLQEEKGKWKIMACRGENREFMSWLKKEKHQPLVKRGELLRVKNNESKSSEIRPQENYEVLRSLSTSLDL